MLAVTFADLWFRARQFLIAIVGVGLVLALALALSGLADGFHAEVAGTVDAVGASSWVMSPSAHGRFTAFAAFPESAEAAVAREPGVHRASAVLFAPEQVVLVAGSSAPLTVNLMGVRPGGLGDPQVVAGHGFAGPEQAVVDSDSRCPWVARSRSAGAATRSWAWSTAAPWTRGIPIVYMPLASGATGGHGWPPLVTAVAIDGDARRALRRVSSCWRRRRWYVQHGGSAGERRGQRIDDTRTLMWIVAAVIVASMLYVAALERKRDFAVLKALGAPRRRRSS